MKGLVRLKKINILAIFLLSLVLFDGKVFASSAKLNISKEEIYVDDSFKIRVNLEEVSAWNIKVTPTGPVKGCIIDQSSASADGSDVSNLFIADCIASDEGTIELKLTGDIKSSKMTDATEVTETLTIDVKKKVVEVPKEESAAEDNNNTSTPEESQQQIPKESEPVVPEEVKPVVKSDNNNVKDVIINGVNVQKGADNAYSINVKKSVASAVVEIHPEDEKATVEVRGTYNLNVGNNSFDVTITSESGIKNIIKLKINRSNIYEIDELGTVLNDNNITDKEITIKSDMIFNEEILNIVKNSNKLVYFNYVDTNNKLLYRWILDGSKINTKAIFTSKLDLDSTDKENIKEKLNADNVITINSTDISDTLDGVKLYVFVGNSFKNGEKIKIYVKDKYRDEFSILNEEVIVNNGYISFDVNNKQTFYVVKEKTVVAPVQEAPKKTDNSIFDNKTLIIGIGAGIIAIILILIIILVLKKNKKKKNNLEATKEITINPEAIQSSNNDTANQMINSDVGLNKESEIEDLVIEQTDNNIGGIDNTANYYNDNMQYYNSQNNMQSNDMIYGPAPSGYVNSNDSYVNYNENMNNEQNNNINNN